MGGTKTGTGMGVSVTIIGRGTFNLPRHRVVLNGKQEIGGAQPQSVGAVNVEPTSVFGGPLWLLVS